jgi:GDP/UDP-N,N'-diacetylbacillosamine 2-epimerase (hydrolysing)
VRKLCYVSGTRADFGLMERALKLARRPGEVDVAVCVTGMHLSALYGETVRDIEASGLPICARLPVKLEEGSGAEMARATGNEILGIVEVLLRERPDALIVLGDRGEMLAGAYAALHLNIPVIHVHGGERSGSVDEPVRHAISKLAHYHFVATAGSRERLVRMGERPERVFVTGAPGLDDLGQAPRSTRQALCADVGLDAAKPVALVIFHPVVQEAVQAGAQSVELVEGLIRAGVQCLWLAPNSDAGSPAIRVVMASYASRPDVHTLTHLARDAYISWMCAADLMVGDQRRQPPGREGALGERRGRAGGARADRRGREESPEERPPQLRECLRRWTRLGAHRRAAWHAAARHAVAHENECLLRI